jgi:hypothetical protein
MCLPNGSRAVDEIRISVEFTDSSEPELPEDTTAAYFSIYAGEDCLTRNRPRRRRLSDSSESVFGPVAGLADWLIENWAPIHWETHSPFPTGKIGDPDSRKPAIPGLTEAFENWSRYLDGDDAYSLMSSEEANVAAYADWQHRHQLGHAASDLAIPSIVILPEDRHIAVSVDRLPGAMQASVEFEGPHGMNRAPTLFVFNKTSFRQELKDFVEATIEQTRSQPEFGQWSNWLNDRWQNAQEEEENSGRRLFWMLGRLGGDRVEQLRSEHPRLSDGLKQLLLDCRLVSRMDELQPAEDVIEDFALRPESVLRKGEEPGWQTVVQESVSQFLPEYAQGYQLARALRKKLGLVTKPIVDLTKTLRRLDVEIEDGVPSPLFRVAVCATRGHRAHIVPSSLDPRLQTDVSNRFACASALGRLLWQSRYDNRQMICAAQGDYALLSQSRRANAFAAEFLLPREAVATAEPGDRRTIGWLAEQYGISRSATEWHAYNVAHDPDKYWA